ncbi:MAG: hypothetical protein ACI8P5_001555, partial [Bacteroidia bacterium]
MKNIIMLVAIQALIISNVLGQSLNGHVHEEGEHGYGPLTGASVVWLG